MIETYGIFRLTCDECAKKSDIAGMKTFVAVWHLFRFTVAPGYSFYRVCCSDGCCKSMREYLERYYKDISTEEVSLDTYAPVVDTGLNYQPLPDIFR